MGNILNKIIEVITYSAIVQGFFFALLIFKNKKWQNKSNKILATLLVILSMSIAHSALIDVEIGGFRIKEPFVLLIGPLLFFYIRELLSHKPFIHSDIFHLLPFLIFSLIILPLTISDVFRDYFLINNIDSLSIGLWVLTIVQYAYYWWKIVRQINLTNKSFQMEFSNLEGKTFLWMKNFLHILGVCLLILTLTIPIAIHTNNYRLVDNIVSLALVATIFFLSYEGLFQEEIFSNIIPFEAIRSEQSIISKTDQHVKPEQVNREAMQKLLAYMDEKKPYLEEGLTLTGLAKQLGLTRNQLSSVINNTTGDNFYKFINKYRVEEVKKIFSDSRNKNYTILAMAYDAGFPSKSSFHKIFKEFTGLTPTEYLNGLQ